LILTGFYRWYHVPVIRIRQAYDSLVQTYPGNIAYQLARYSRLIQFQFNRGILQQGLALSEPATPKCSDCKVLVWIYWLNASKWKIRKMLWGIENTEL
jgi:hypothetical protein